MTAAPISSLRKFVAKRETEERCDTCGAPLPPKHSHNLEPAIRRIRCACDSCAVLYSSVYKLIPDRVQRLDDFRLTDAQWDELAIPISLAFFFHSTPLGRVTALYPGPAGATESLLRLDLWDDIAAANTELTGMQSDVEALLVDRIGAIREHYIAPIDECYRLAGLIRMHWRGLAGGVVVWGHIAQFFENLQKKADACRP